MIVNFKNWIIDLFKLVLKLDLDLKEPDNQIFENRILNLRNWITVYSNRISILDSIGPVIRPTFLKSKIRIGIWKMAKTEPNRSCLSPSAYEYYKVIRLTFLVLHLEINWHFIIFITNINNILNFVKTDNPTSKIENRFGYYVKYYDFSS